MTGSPRLRVAVVGGGAAGMAAAHRLQRSHDVTLYEASPTLGGHAHSVEVDDGRGGSLEVDTAFLIYNQLHYPSFVAWIRELGVEASTAPAEMSASFVDDDADVHFALSRGLDALFAQRRNLVRPRFYRLFVELLVFRRRAHADLRSDRLSPDVTLGQYVRDFSPLFRDHFAIPLARAIWSLPGDRIAEYPAREILRFFDNHGLLRGDSGDAWRTFVGGSGIYVRAFAKAFTGATRLASPVRAVTRDAGGVVVVSATETETFDRVVLATHADRSLRLLTDPTPEETRALGAWTYHASLVVLHTDPRVLSADRRLWASWNIVTRGGHQQISYFLNRVQSLAGKTSRDLFLTLTDEAKLVQADIDPKTEIARFAYDHPVFDERSIATQAFFARQGADRTRTTYFAGSYTGFGFHEDAVRSALRVADHLSIP